MLADGDEAIADLAILRDQDEVFGSVASTPTAWRLLASIDAAALATARQVVWMPAAEARSGIPTACAGGSCRTWSWTWTPPW